jgi:lysine 2,3-aminomutase
VLSPQALDRALDYIRSDPGIWEAILTGGDPLAASPRRLADVFRRLGEIEHVKTLRVHTRVPLVDPSRVSPALLDALRAAGRPVWIAVHANHPREFTPAGRAALARLVDAGFPLVSQTVLLRGVNDDAETLAELMRRFVENRVKPYYLHHPDLAPGTARFRLSIADGLALASALRGRLSGLAQPLYVLDIPGGSGKAPLGPAFVSSGRDGVVVKDWRGVEHRYDDIVQSPIKPHSAG